MSGGGAAHAHGALGIFQLSGVVGMSRHRGEEGTLVGHAPLERAMVLAQKPAHFQDWRNSFF